MYESHFEVEFFPDKGEYKKLNLPAYVLEDPKPMFFNELSSNAVTTRYLKWRTSSNDIDLISTFLMIQLRNSYTKSSTMNEFGEKVNNLVKRTSMTMLPSHGVENL